ncbi:MAG: monofunctional biosynthetic peptidoglycan transglycosylase [Acidobacteriota bacterium]
MLAVGFGYGAFLFLTLPDVRGLRLANPDSTAFIDLRIREAHARGEPARRVQRWIGYGRIAPSLIRAVLVAEDSKFWQHEGVDFEQLRESIDVDFERMEFARGGSTITQQLARNLYLSPTKNPIRKLRELMIARQLETELSKQRILELYLNVIEWGDGIYGAEAASRTYFQKSAADLTPQESALLAAAIPSPRVFDPGHPSPRLRRRQQMVFRRMGLVTPPPVQATGPPAALPLPDVPPAAPGEAGVPAELPGQALPAPQDPQGKPPGARSP